jgi:hypothetical protein
MIYVKHIQGISSRSEIINAIRNFLTNSNLGWVESQHTQNSTDEILIQTGAQDGAGLNGIIHIIATAQTEYDDIEFHGYHPNHPAFQSPNSFDSPDTSYLPGGANYDAATDFYYPSYPQKVCFAYPGDIMMAGDSKIFYFSANSSQEKELIFAGLFECEGGEEYAMKILKADDSLSQAIYWASAIRKGDNINFIIIGRKTDLVGGGGHYNIFQSYPTVDKTPSRYIAKPIGLVVYGYAGKVFDLTDLYVSGKNLAMGDHITIQNDNYKVMISNDYGSVVVKIGAEL